MKAKLWGVIVFLLTVAVAATPASGREAYVATGSISGDAVYMTPDADGSFSGPEDLQIVAGSVIQGYGASRANGIGDFDGDGDLDYIMAVGKGSTHVAFVIPKTGPGNQFGDPVRVASFSEGRGPTGMTVADFNGDKMLDFVVTSYYSANCVLFLNTGGGQPDVYEFEPNILTGAGSSRSFGIDAADFNNDGKTDFIVASATTMLPFKVNLWQSNDDSDVPVPSFDSREFFLSPPPPVQNKGYGIAAADFIIDDDGNADLAVSNVYSLDIYQGDGFGSFTFFDSYPLPLHSSPLDNGDFNRDGKQDLIAGNFGSDPGSVVVLFGDGTGDFRFSDNDIYTRSDLMPRMAVTGLPFEFNQTPVALLTPETITLTVGEAVEFDGSESYDEDGTIVSYEWDFGDGAAAPMATHTMAAAGTNDYSGEPQSSYVYFDSGSYYVTLKVTDDQGATATVQAEVEVKPMAVDVYFSPRRLNLKSKGKWVTATIRLPRGYNAGMVDTSSLFLAVEGKAWIQAKSDNRHRYYKKYHKKYRRTRKLKVKFDRQALIQAINGATGKTSLTVMGDISIDVSNMGHISSDVANAKLEFSGTGTIKAFEKKKRSFKKYLQQQIRRFFSKGKWKHNK